MRTISVASDYSVVPGGRYTKDGPFSGETFRKDIVEPLLRTVIAEHSKLSIELDGVAGYATSFLEELFGGLVRSLEVPIRPFVDIITDNPVRLREVESYIADEEKKL